MRTVLVLSVAGLLAACGSDADRAQDRPEIVVTTSILGDVVANLVGDAADVEVVMPRGADPHDFAASAQQVSAMRSADALVVNGLGFEEALLDTIASAEDDGVLVIRAADAIDPRPLSEGEHGHEDGEEEPDGELDPHLFTDPVQMRAAAEHVADELREQVPTLDVAAVDDQVERYLELLDDLDREVERLLAAVPSERRVLVTNHEVFGYFADRYGFEVLGAVIPGGSTLAEPSAAALAELAREIEEHSVPAVFIDASSPARLAEALAAEGADVEVVELFSESLGEEGSGGETYVDMVRTNAERISRALR